MENLAGLAKLICRTVSQCCEEREEKSTAEQRGRHSVVVTLEIGLMDFGLPKKMVVAPLTDEELDAVTVVFHQFETGLREGCIFTKVRSKLDVEQYKQQQL